MKHTDINDYKMQDKRRQAKCKRKNVTIRNIAFIVYLWYTDKAVKLLKLQ